jgi:hypothetical protein
MKIQFFMKNGPRIHEKSFSTQKAIKRSSFCSIFNENRMKIIFWLQILALFKTTLRRFPPLPPEAPVPFATLPP